MVVFDENYFCIVRPRIFFFIKKNENFLKFAFLFYFFFGGGRGSGKILNKIYQIHKYKTKENKKKLKKKINKKYNYIYLIYTPLKI